MEHKTTESFAQTVLIAIDKKIERLYNLLVGYDFRYDRGYICKIYMGDVVIEVGTVLVTKRSLRVVRLTCKSPHSKPEGNGKSTD